MDLQSVDTTHPQTSVPSDVRTNRDGGVQTWCPRELQEDEGGGERKNWRKIRGAGENDVVEAGGGGIRGQRRSRTEEQPLQQRTVGVKIHRGHQVSPVPHSLQVWGGAG